MNTTCNKTIAPTKKTQQIILKCISEPVSPTSYSQISQSTEQLVLQAHTSAQKLAFERQEAEKRAKEAARYAFD